jgi:hypothetical protein
MIGRMPCAEGWQHAESAVYFICDRTVGSAAGEKPYAAHQQGGRFEHGMPM